MLNKKLSIANDLLKGLNEKISKTGNCKASSGQADAEEVKRKYVEKEEKYNSQIQELKKDIRSLSGKSREFKEYSDQLQK